MNTEVVTITCRDYSGSVGILTHGYCEILLKNYGYKVELQKHDEHTIDLTIDDKIVRIIMSRGEMKDCDVCIVGWWIHLANFIAMVKHQASWCKQHHPEAPIIMVGDAKWKNVPSKLKDVEVEGQKLFNKKNGDELVMDIDIGVKYIECSWESGRGLKILIDEIVFAYFSKVKEDQEQERERKEADEIRREKTKQNLFLFKKILDVLHYI